MDSNTSFVDLSYLIQESKKEKKCFNDFCKDLKNLLIPILFVVGIFSAGLAIACLI